MNTTTSLDVLLRHADWTHALAQRLVADPGFAADAAQETLLRAIRAQPEVTSPRAWLGRVLRNVVRDERRRVRPKTLGSAEPAAELVERAESHERVVRVVLELTDTHRDVLLERYFEGRAPKEIARREGVAVQTASNRLTKARAALRVKLEHEGGRDWLVGIVPLLHVNGAPIGALASSLVLAACVVVIGSAGWWISTNSRAAGHAPVIAMPETASALDSNPRPFEDSSVIDDRQAARLSVTSVDAPGSSAEQPQPTGSIEGTVLDVAGQPYRGILLTLQSTEAEHEVRTDSSGHYRLRGVAANTDVALTIELAGSEKHEESLRLDPNTLLRHDIVLANVTRIEGQLFDAMGAGVPGADIVLANPSFLSSEFFLRNPMRPTQIVAEAVTMEDGRFVIELVPPGRYVLGEETHKKDSYMAYHAQPLLESHVVPAGALVQHVELLQRQTSTIKGRVESYDGLPVGSISLIATMKNVTGYLHAKSSRIDGSFCFRGVPKGTLNIRTTGDSRGHTDELTQGEARNVHSGANDVVIVLDRGGIVSFKVLGPAGQRLDGWCTALPNAAVDIRGRAGIAGFSESRAHRFESLTPGIYSLAAWSDRDGLYGFKPNVTVRAGDELGPFQVRMGASAWLEVKHEGPTPSAHLRIYRGDSMLRESPLARDKPRRIAVPPGQLQVHLIDGNSTTKHDVWIDAGQAAELTIGG